MSHVLSFTKIGDDVNEAIIGNVLVKTGDKVAKGDVLLELETDKAVLEIQADADSVVKTIFVEKGKTVKEGDKFVELTTGAADSKAAAPAKDESKNLAPAPAADQNKNKAMPEKEPAPQQAPDKNNVPANKPASAVKDFILPDLGDGIETASLVRVLIKKGDMLDEKSNIAELETDKATFEVPFTDQGEVLEVFIKDNIDVKPGQKMFSYKTQESGAATNSAAVPQAVESATLASESMASEAKASPSASSQTSAVEANSYSSEPQAAKADANLSLVYDLSKINASPSVRRLAREIGVNLSKVTGSAKNSKILAEDVKAYAKALLSQGGTAVSGVPSLKLPDFGQFGTIEIEPMNNIKKATVKAMARSWEQIPLVTNFDSVDITRLEELRNRYKPQFEKKGLKLTQMPLIIKLIADLLLKHRRINSSFDASSMSLILKNYVNIGIAVDTPSGLLVPVIKNVQNKSVEQIATELLSLSTKARERKIHPSDLSGASFTISNLGGIGGKAFTPLVNWPEVAILGIARGEISPVYNGKEFVPRFLMPVSLSYDHRAVDGAEGARFLTAVVQRLEDPASVIF